MIQFVTFFSINWNLAVVPDSLCMRMSTVSHRLLFLLQMAVLRLSPPLSIPVSSVPWLFSHAWFHHAWFTIGVHSQVPTQFYGLIKNADCREGEFGLCISKERERHLSPSEENISVSC
jgi:hypothetical protein